LKTSLRSRITVIASTLDQAKAAFGAGADEVALEPWEFHIAAFEAAAAFKGSKKLLISLPVAIISHKEAEKIMKIIGSGLIDGGIAANVGQLELIRSLPLRIAGTQMNAMNGYTVQAYKDMGFDRVTLSLELTKPQLRDISGAGTAVSIYGRAQLMQLRHCPVKEYRGCRSCDGFTGKMVDEGGREFPLCNVRQEDGCLVRLLNCLPTDITDLYGELPEPEAVQLAFYDEAPEKVRERIAAAMAARDGRKVSPAKNATRGHWNRAVD
ncbi:MAG: U32 family peptidase, partial [Christensenellales bacterium]